jgi:hypothetical protein
MSSVLISAVVLAGVSMALARGDRRRLSRVHHASTILMMVSIGASIAFMSAGL